MKTPLKKFFLIVLSQFIGFENNDRKYYDRDYVHVKKKNNSILIAIKYARI